MCNCVGKVPDNVYKDVVTLTKYYMKKYHIPADHVIRHWDVNGKIVRIHGQGKTMPDGRNLRRQFHN